ncbi:hypothetical protein B5C34_13730 [Pacificimonas flava]|uniref:N-acetyltransferase domain-containing protein n=2 Tax=Pacificimonas TaxID=1960290 RepID=A0A219B8D6_9SPHN|nr:MULTISPECIES: GNAT family N-acetyltransferase [Pacificimonas]MBZ6379885.1 GNAT family N-acetyltransferase [Pacificimonas aurantium]OWV34413.1 hypothetical protein B5C34_13730 [Pacificimonas flava]
MPVRRAKGTEIERCREIERQAAAVFDATQYAHLDLSTPQDEAVVRAAYVDQLLWVAVDEEDRPVGHLTAAKGQRGMLIAQIDVLPDHQRKGLARELIAEAEAEASHRGLPYIWLRTFRDIPWNAPFYARLGYEVVEDAVDESEVVDQERSAGLDPATRVTMRKALPNANARTANS